MDSILIILKKKMAQGLHLPLYWDYFLYHSYIQQISGERLQDHWSSCLKNLITVQLSVSNLFVDLNAIVHAYLLHMY